LWCGPLSSGKWLESSGKPVPVPHHPHSKEFLTSIESKSTLFQFEAITLVLPLHALVKSPSPAFLQAPFSTCITEKHKQGMQWMAAENSAT